jgi:hypothetical protein
MITARPLENYPENGKHKRLWGLGIPLHITLGEDAFPKHRHLWAVYPAAHAAAAFEQFFWNNVKSKHPGHARLFQTARRAVHFARGVYGRWLVDELDKMDAQTWEIER